MKLTATEIQLYNSQRERKAISMPCWAPLKSLYIGFRGNVSVCCFNKTHVVGKYPEQSINEIWFGEKVKDLREKLKEGDFSLGCRGCHEIISAGNFNGLPAKNFDHLTHNLKGYPTKIDFELSNECNLECIMCRGEFSSAIRKNREKLPPIQSVYDSQFITQLEEFIPHLEHSHFIGGEPFMVPIYLEIWERMIEINPSIKVSVQTNGTILTERIKKILNAIPVGIAVSIDSIEEDNYERIRKNGNFKKVISNINYFREYCRKKGTQFHLSICPMVQNWRELPEMISMANDLDCLVFFNPVYYPKECSLTRLSSEELANIIETLSAVDLPQNTGTQKTNKESYFQVIKHFIHWEKEARSREEFTQIMGKSEGWDAFCNGLRVYLEERENLSFEESEKTYQTIMRKLNYIVETARSSGQAESAMDQITGVAYHDIYRSVPTANQEHLLYLFKTFIMPLPDSKTD